jgi:hypothetical protein
MKTPGGLSLRRSCGLAALLALGLSACGGGGSKTSSTATSPTSPTPTNKWTIAGHVVATNTDSAIGGATLTPGWSLAPVTADGNGNYELTNRDTPPSAPAPVTISQAGYISHDVWMSWTLGTRSDVTLDMIRDAPPFSKDFYQQFARDMYDKSDGSPWPLQRWTSAPNFYLRTVDDANHAVEQTVINTTIEALRRGVSAFTAGHYSAGSIETGADARPDATDWISVVFKRHDPDQPCGTAYVGRNPNTINLWLDTCGCGSIRVSPSVTMHEVGHAMGFFHVSDPHSLMYPFDESGCRQGNLSPNEAYHASIVYSRPRFNAEPDHDPKDFKTLSGSRGGGPLVRN